VKAVGIKQLKARLSEYLRRVKGGETFLVTEREEVVAELGPARHMTSPAGDVDGVVDALATAQEVTPPSLPKDRWTWRVTGAGLPEGTAQALLDDRRQDR
jgi:antitoxin (DNA-binding transcriptional repressor) of toxin-antitoxin stability system